MDDKQCFTLQRCPKTHSIKCMLICVQSKEVNNTTKQQRKLLRKLKAMIHSVHKRYISTTRKPIAYIECPLQLDKEYGLHHRLDEIKQNMYCDKAYPKLLVPKKAYNLLLPMDQHGEYEQEFMI